MSPFIYELETMKNTVESVKGIVFESYLPDLARYQHPQQKEYHQDPKHLGHEPPIT